MLLRYTQFLVALFLVAGLSAQTPLAVSTVELTGAQEVLPVATTASGQLTVTIFTNFDISVEGSFENLSSAVATEIAGGLHLHIGYAGQNGPVAIPINIVLSADSLSGTIEAAANTFSVPIELLNADLGEAYFNLHTRNYPGGELRGIIYGPDLLIGLCNLLGSNQTPAVNTNANGGIYAELDPFTDILTVTGSFQNLSSPLNTAIAGGVHLHIGAPGESGPVDLVINTTLDADGLGGVFNSDNMFTLTPAQVQTFLGGNYYVNVHSMNYPGGELRGQVLPLARTAYRAHLSGSNEWPVVTTSAEGQVVLEVSPDSVLIVTGSFSGLSSPVATEIAGGAHLHLGLAGENGPVIFPLNIDLDADSLGGTFTAFANFFELDGSQVEALLNRGVYVNIHTRNHLSGELRGQVLNASQYVYTAYLNGNQSIPAALTEARGMIKIERNGTNMTASGSFTGLSSDLNVNILGGVHLHTGYAGQAGPVLLPITVNQTVTGTTGATVSPFANTFPLSITLNDTLDSRQLYVNVHSLDYPGGEIRGQVLGEAQSYFYAPLSSTSEPAYTPTDALGMLAVEVYDTTVLLSGSFRNLEGPFAAQVAGGMHLHNSLAGTNGGIAASVNTEIAVDGLSGVIVPDSNFISLSQEQLTSLLNRELYANIHSQAYTAGEVRGQLLPLAGTYFHTSLMSINSIPLSASGATGGLKLELTNSTLTVSGSVSGLESAFNLALAQGAHLHLAGVGMTGPVVIPLNPIVAVDQLSVEWRAADNQFQLADSVFTALYNGEVYANVHTLGNPSGEVRGQIRGDLNIRPAGSIISVPGDGVTVDLSGDAGQIFDVAWSESQDLDGDTVVYVWQLSTEADFSNVIFAINTGTTTGYITDFGTVDLLLEGAGVDVGTSVTLYHRVIAGDGSNHRSSVASTLIIDRGLVSGLEENQPLGFNALLFPNLTIKGQAVNLEITTGQAFKGELLIIDQLGRQLSRQAINAFAGTQRLSVATDRLATGNYFVVLRLNNGKLAYSTRLQLQ